MVVSSKEHPANREVMTPRKNKTENQQNQGGDDGDSLAHDSKVHGRSWAPVQFEDSAS
jgi:hypothetical protein